MLHVSLTSNLNNSIGGRRFFSRHVAESLYAEERANMSKTLMLVGILLLSIIWQPGHNYLMTSSMSMSSEVHSLTTMAPFMAILLLLIKTK